jgi:hypothetical protein
MTALRSVRGSYATLFSVAFHHDYYNANGGACSALAVVPTPACAQTMRSLGMIFKDQGSGFAVLIEQAKIGALIAWLAARATPERGCWAWLSFQLSASNPAFLGITGLPIATNMVTQKLHLSNLQTVMPGTTILLGDSDGIGAASLYPVTGAGLTVSVSEGRGAVLTDLSGAPVSARASAAPGQMTFDLGSLPDGFYRLSRTGADGAPVASSDVAPSYVYSPSLPLALGQLDLLLAQPQAGVGDPSAFPVTALALTASAGPPAVNGVSLTLPFRARDTYWRYYIVSQGTRGALAPDLAIAGNGATFVKSTEALPNGDQAVVFTAGTALPLQQVSQYRFSLSGQRQAASGGRDSISVAVLPTPAAAPVWPGPAGEALTGSSEIYVYV